MAVANSIIVRLSPETHAVIDQVTADRSNTAKWSRTPRYGAPTDDEQQRHLNWIGAHGEGAFAQHRGAAWNGSPGQFLAPDVGYYEVRSTEHRRGGLILHDRDIEKGGDPFILAIILDCWSVELAGWIWALEGIRQAYRGRLRSDGYLVPRDKLRPMHSLPDVG